MDWTNSGVKEVVAAVRDGNASATEILEDYISRIELYNTSVNALVVLDFDNARSQAQQIDQKRSHGEALGALAGVPLSIKEAFAMRDCETTSGLKRYQGQIPPFDAPAVQVLRKTDAVIIGKSNVPTSLSGFGCTNPIYGQTKNPWSPECTPGGSSGGSAAAVASGFSALDLASDLSGSIRIPASWCGVAGFRPSPGRLSKRSHLPWPLTTLLEPPESVAGFIARSAQDLAHTWHAVSGATSRGSKFANAITASTETKRALRIGLWLGTDALPVSQSVAAAISNVADMLATLGHKVENYRPPFDEARLIQLARRLTDAEISFGLNDEAWSQWDHDTFSTRNYLGDLDAVKGLRYRIDDDLKRFDILLCPATAIVAPMACDVAQDKTVISIDQRHVELRSIADWSLVTSIVQLPTVTIPIALSPDKLPIAMQVATRSGNDFDVLDAARLIELALGPIGKPDLAALH